MGVGVGVRVRACGCVCMMCVTILMFKGYLKNNFSNNCAINSALSDDVSFFACTFGYALIRVNHLRVSVCACVCMCVSVCGVCVTIVHESIISTYYFN